MEDKAQLVQDYMAVLLATGFSVEEVLTRGTEYLEHYLYENHAATTDVDMLIAQTVLQAAKNLHIDAQSQVCQRYYGRNVPISAMEFKQMHEGMNDE